MDTVSDTIDQRFSVGSAAQLRVSNVSGSIEISTGEAGTLQVRAEKQGNERSQDQTRIDLTQDGDTVTVTTRSDGSSGFGFHRGICSVLYHITVPPGCAVTAKGVSSDIAIAGTRAEVVAETVSGEVEVAQASGDCTVRSVSGDVDLHDLDGTASVHTTSGDLRILNSRLSRLNFHTVSGDARVETPLTTGELYYAQSVSGDLTLVVPPSAGATIRLKTVSGDASSDLPAQLVKSGRRQWHGTVNGGGATVEMTSVSGDLRIVAGTQVTEPEDVTTRRDSMETMSEPEVVDRPEFTTTEILQQLERGEITLSEAMERLRTAG